MSRTDKDRPYWVRSEDPLELRYESHMCGAWRSDVLDCDLEDSAKYRFARPRCYSNCGYRLVHRPVDAPPKDFIDHMWNNVERRRERDELGGIRRLVNAGELEDVEFPSWQHRHCGQWLWY